MNVGVFISLLLILFLGEVTNKKDTDVGAHSLQKLYRQKKSFLNQVIQGFNNFRSRIDRQDADFFPTGILIIFVSLLAGSKFLFGVSLILAHYFEFSSIVRYENNALLINFQLS